MRSQGAGGGGTDSDTRWHWVRDAAEAGTAQATKVGVPCVPSANALNRQKPNFTTGCGSGAAFLSDVFLVVGR